MIKRLIIICFLASIFDIAMSQAPYAFNYQAIVRNDKGIILRNREVDLQFSILQGSSSGPIVYQETHTATTDFNGVIRIVIGEGTIVSGDITTIDWSTGPYFLKSEIDTEGQANYVEMGTSQLLSVPYALHANTVQYPDDADADSLNEIQILTISNDTIYLSDGGYVVLPAELYDDNDPTNELQSLSVSLTGDSLIMSDGGFIIVPGISAANNDLVFWNKLGSPAEVQNSEIGPDGVVIGGGTFTTGLYGGGYYDVLNTPHLEFGYIQNIVDVGGPFTIELWWKPNFAASDNQCAVGVLYTLDRNVGPNMISYLDYRWQGNVRSFELVFVVGESQMVCGKLFQQPVLGFDWSAGEWIHVAVTYDPPNGTADLYLNGIKLETTAPYANNYPPIPYAFPSMRTASPLGIGWSYSTSPCMHGAFGVIDNIKIWKIAKTDFSDRFTE